jgi:hypothetical protein
VLVSSGTHLFQLSLEERDPISDTPSVHLELSLTWAANAHTSSRSARSPACLPGEVRPGTGQPWQAVLELCQLNLQRALARVRVPGKDVEDQCRAIQDLDLSLLAKHPFDFALLPRRKFVVKDNHIVRQVLTKVEQFGQLACADQGRRPGTGKRLPLLTDDLQARGVRQRGQFFQRVLYTPQVSISLQFDANQQCSLYRRGFVCDVTPPLRLWIHRTWVLRQPATDLLDRYLDNTPTKVAVGGIVAGSFLLSLKPSRHLGLIKSKGLATVETLYIEHLVPFR